MNFKSIIFDLDGTLVDSLPDISEAMNAVLKARGFSQHPMEAYLDFVGDGIEKMVNRAFWGTDNPGHPTDEYLHAFRRQYASQLTRKTRPYEGIPELIETCARSGLKIAVLSNKPDKATKEIVNKLLPGQLFDRIWGARDGVPKKPDPAGAILLAEKMNISPHRCIFLGDMPVDMKAGRAAGMYTIGAQWGYRSAEQLICAGARMLICSPVDLTDWL